MEAAEELECGSREEEAVGEDDSRYTATREAAVWTGEVMIVEQTGLEAGLVRMQ